MRNCRNWGEGRRERARKSFTCTFSLFSKPLLHYFPSLLFFPKLISKRFFISNLGTLFDSFPNCNKQPSDSLRAETPPVFITLKHCFAYCFAQWGPAGVCIHPSSLLSIILQCLGGDQFTIPHMKGYILSFHMGCRSLPCPKYLQRYGLG